MGTKVEVGSSRIGFLGILTIVFVILKATGYIDWSWYLVFLPIWGPLALVLIISAGAGTVALLVLIYEHFSEKRKRR
jgi:hypothetical protein